MDITPSPLPTIAAVQFFHEGTVALAEVERTGIRIDRKYLKTCIVEVEDKMKTLTEELSNSDFIRKWKAIKGDKFNMNSAAQLAQALFKEPEFEGDDRDTVDTKKTAEVFTVLGLPPVKLTESGKASTDKATLESLKIPEIDKLLEIRKLSKMASTYLGGILRELNDDDILRSFFHLNTVATFRSSSSAINFQNLPIRDKVYGKLIRSAFKPREGRALLEIDYGGIEVKISACNHHDPNLIAYINDPTTDMHRDTAIELYQMLKEEVSKDIRQGSKAGFVFAQFYGSWWRGCAITLWDTVVANPDVKTTSGITVLEHLKGVTCEVECEVDAATGKIIGVGGREKDQKTRWVTKKLNMGKLDHFQYWVKVVEKKFWEERFPAYKKWKEKQWEAYKKAGYITLPTGFVCSTVMDDKQVTNYPIQGPAFHCLLRSLTLLGRWLKEQGMKSCIVGQIHDSIVLDVALDEVDRIMDKATEIMTQTLREYWSWIIVPMEVEADLTPRDGSWFEKAAVDKAPRACDCGARWLWKQKDGSWKCPQCGDVTSKEGMTVIRRRPGQIWIEHPESSSHFVGTHEDMDELCVELGPAVTGTEEEYQALVRARQAETVKLYTRQVHDFLAKRGRKGATEAELTKHLGLDRVLSRKIRQALKGEIHDSGMTRPGEDGDFGTVWTLN